MADPFADRRKARMRRRKFPAIPQPVPGDDKSMFETVMALKESVEILTGQRKRGRLTEAAPTYEELIEMGVIKSDQVPNQ